MVFCSCLLWLASSKSLFSFSSSLLVSILSSQADSPTLQNLDFAPAAARFIKIKVWDLKMLSNVFGGSLGLVLGPLGGCLGALLVLLRALAGTLNFQNFFFGLP